MESSDDYELIDLCLKGFKKAVRIAGGLDVPVRTCEATEWGGGGGCVRSVARTPITTTLTLFEWGASL